MLMMATVEVQNISEEKAVANFEFYLTEFHTEVPLYLTVQKDKCSVTV
jgi:hypothetical protein